MNSIFKKNNHSYFNNNHSYFTWDTPTDSLVLLQEAQGRCAEENLQARLGIEPATSRLVITYADHLASAHPQRAAMKNQWQI